MGKQDIQDKIDLLELFHDRLGVGKNTLDQLHTEKNKLEEQERTVNGTVFDSVEAANEERKHYVGNVRYETIDEADRIKKEQERRRKEHQREIERQEAKKQENIMTGKVQATLSLICAFIAWQFTPMLRFFAAFAVIGVILGILSRKYHKTKRAWVGIVISFMIIVTLISGIYDEDEGKNSAELTQTQSSQVHSENNSIAGENEYIFENSNKRNLTEKEIKGLTEDERMLAACEILARHGVIFNLEDDRESIQSYFETKDWYTPTVIQSEFDYTVLNIYEASNLSLLLNLDEIQEEIYGKADNNAADIPEEELLLPESDKRTLSSMEVGTMTEDERYMAACEILARHGADFTNIGDGGKTQNYFEQKSWYKPTVDAAEMDYSYFNVYEIANLDLLTSYNEAQESEGTNTYNQGTESEYLLPESSSRYLTAEDLQGMDKEMLRLARNEIYAKHGRMYETDDLREYFSSKSWYYGYLSAEEFDDSVFNEYEKANLDLIKSAEGMGTAPNANWIDTYIAEDDQTIIVSSADDTGVVLTFVGYSEESWQTKTDVLSYRNTEKTQVSDPYYYDGSLVQETVYTITETGIQVETLPSGGWADGFYLRQ